MHGTGSEMYLSNAHPETNTSAPAENHIVSFRTWWHFDRTFFEFTDVKKMAESLACNAARISLQMRRLIGRIQSFGCS